MAYAEKTTVSPDRSQAEIKKILSAHKATAFVFGESKDTAMVQFEMSGKRIKFLLPLPIWGKERNRRNIIASSKEVEQMTRTKWRALVLCIKAKLEAVESGITTLEQEFMAHIVLPNGQTVGDIVLPEIESSYGSREMPLLLGMR